MQNPGPVLASDKVVHKTFIQRLDEYQYKLDFQYHDMNSVLHLSHYHYITNRLSKYSGGEGYDVGNVPPLPLLPIWSLYPADIMGLSLPLPVPLPLPLPVPVKKIHKKNIDVCIKTFADLIQILVENEYREDTEYNIDLYALVQIKNELQLLDKMVGITKFKDAVLDQILYFVQRLHCGGKEPDFMHTVLCGPPGTGKTEIAQILGKMYSKIGILKNQVFKKVSRSDLVAGYLGQTAIKTKNVIQECLGGCLFIDEAYSLASGENGESDSYSKECLDTLCEALSEYKGDLMVIIAGYENELDDTFFRANRGLNSRFIWRFKLEEYSASELMEIFVKKIEENEWAIYDSDSDLASASASASASAMNPTTLLRWFRDHRDSFRHFGRDMELLFTYSKIAHGRRIYGKPDTFRKILSLDDLNAAMATFLTNSTKKKESGQIYGLYI